MSYDNTASTPLPKVFVNIKNIENTFTDADTTDSKGNYVLTPLTVDEYIFNLKTSLAWGGGNPLDALLINRYYIGAIKTFGDAPGKLPRCK